VKAIGDLPALSKRRARRMGDWNVRLHDRRECLTRVRVCLNPSFAAFLLNFLFSVSFVTLADVAKGEMGRSLLYGEIFPCAL